MQEIIDHKGDAQGSWEYARVLKARCDKIVLEIVIHGVTHCHTISILTWH